MVSTLRGGPQPRWVVRVTTLLLWALALFSVGYWVLRFMATPVGVPTQAPVVGEPAPTQPAAVARLLGAGAQQAAEPAADAPPPELAKRFVLTGVVAGRSGGGAALLAIDGRPPRPYLVGSRLDENLIVQAVEGRRVMIGAEPGGPHALVLELPVRQ
ncbi:type II secretion system protein N [Ramlibacter sp. AN1015]|uniref:type II secretion system protein N n=1 Tax=Ramlibacter sp. AN1015 TaxID=3133428 RepID=UPI0030BFE7BD